MGNEPIWLQRARQRAAVAEQEHQDALNAVFDSDPHSEARWDALSASAASYDARDAARGVLRRAIERAAGDKNEREDRFNQAEARKASEP